MNKSIEKRGDSKNNRYRLIFIIIAIFIQILWLTIIFEKLNYTYNYLAIFVKIISIFIVISIYNSEMIANIKLPWIIFILLLPIMGLLIYFMVKYSGTTVIVKKRLQISLNEAKKYLDDDSEVKEELKKLDEHICNISRYISEYSYYPIYNNVYLRYFSDSSQAIKVQMQEMKKAKKYIFMSYYSIEDANIFSDIYDILKEKSQEGLEIRIFYDDIGSLGFIDNIRFIKKMEANGIQCRIFNPVSPIFNLLFNNRDHRKITIIDGAVAFTGGYNIADEYFNIVKPYGYWKDTGIMLKGNATKSLLVSFLETWNANRKSNINNLEDSKYFINSNYISDEKIYVQAYADSPLDSENLSENVYISLINAATKYIYIMTPYMIITDAMAYALAMAAKKGVDIRVVIPGIPDKKLIYNMTLSFCSGLAKNGIKIYKYTLGFCHAKQMIIDDKLAICGTINFDYRSLYLNFENAVLFTASQALYDMKNDFLKTFENSEDISYKYTHRSRPMNMLDSIIRLFAPLL